MLLTVNQYWVIYIRDGKIVEIYNMDSGNAMQCNWNLILIQMNALF